MIFGGIGKSLTHSAIPVHSCQPNNNPHIGLIRNHPLPPVHCTVFDLRILLVPEWIIFNCRAIVRNLLFFVWCIVIGAMVDVCYGLRVLGLTHCFSMIKRGRDINLKPRALDRELVIVKTNIYRILFSLCRIPYRPDIQWQVTPHMHN